MRKVIIFPDTEIHFTFNRKDFVQCFPNNQVLD